MIKSIRFENVKGQSRTEILAPFTAITGDNTKGKTTIADALTIGLLGYHPLLGKTNGATFALASDSSMLVELATDKGNWTRQWKQTGKSIKATEKLPEGVTDEAVARLLPSFSPGQFIVANDKTRLAMIADCTGHVAGEKLTDEVVEILRSASIQLTGQPQRIAFPDPFAFAAAVADYLANESKASAALEKRFTETLQGLTAMDSADAAPVSAKAKAFDSLQAALGKLREKRASAETKLEAMEQRSGAADHAAEELANLGVPDGDTIKASRTELANLNREIQAVKAQASQQEGAATLLGREVEGLRRQVESIQRRYGQETLDVKALGTLVDELGAIPAAEVPTATLAMNQRNAEVAKNTADGNLTAASNEHTRATKAWNEFAALECCPTCKASAPGWKDTVKASLEARLKDTEVERVKAAEAVAKAGEELDKAERAYKAARELDNKRAQLPIAEAKLTDAATMARLRMDIVEKDGKRQAAEEHASSAYERLARLEADAQEHEETVANADKLADLQRAAQDRAPIEDMDAAREAVAELNRQIEAAELELEQAKAGRQALQQAEQRARDADSARTQAEDATTKKTETKRLEAAVREKMQTAMEDAFKPVAELAARFSEGVLPSPIALKDGEVGRYTSSGWVPFSVLSGAEQLVAGAAIVAALGARTSGLVVLDELSRMTAQRRHAFASNLVAALEDGTVKQVVVMDHDSRFWHEFGTGLLTGKPLGDLFTKIAA
jgi:DNA repair exonuclease SbcCD ATPase subunit